MYARGKVILRSTRSKIVSRGRKPNSSIILISLTESGVRSVDNEFNLDKDFVMKNFGPMETFLYGAWEVSMCTRGPK